MQTEKPFSGRMTLFGSTSLTAESGVGIPIIIESTGELKVVNYGKASSTVTAFATETTGEQKNVLYGKAGGTVTAQKVETTGEQDFILHGKTSGGTISALLNDSAKILRTREFEPYEGTAVVTINTTATTIYTVPASTVSVVEIEIANTDSVANTYDFHIIPSGGTAAIGNRMRTGTSLVAAGVDRLGPYHVLAGAFFQALVTTVGGANGDLNAIAVVKEYGPGDAV